MFGSYGEPHVLIPNTMRESFCLLAPNIALECYGSARFASVCYRRHLGLWIIWISFRMCLNLGDSNLVRLVASESPARLSQVASFHNLQSARKITSSSSSPEHDYHDSTTFTRSERFIWGACWFISSFSVIICISGLVSFICVFRMGFIVSFFLLQRIDG